MKDEADLCIGLLDSVFARIWTCQALTDEEKGAIHGPMAGVIYKYGGNIPIEWQLAMAIGFVAAPRYVEWKRSKMPGAAPGQITNRAA